MNGLRPGARESVPGGVGPLGRRAVGAVVGCAVVYGLALLGPGGAAVADVPSPSPTELPTIRQSLPDVQENGCRKPSAKSVDGLPWAQVYLHPEAVWPLGRGNGVTVAVLASGVDSAAGGAAGPLAGRLRLGPRVYGQGDAGRDCVGHGTLLAGLVAARATGDGGPAGVAPEATVLAVAVTDDAGTTTPDLLAQGIRAAADNGARIALVGVPAAGSSQQLVDAVGYATAKGVLLVAPTAPDDAQAKGAVYPAALPGVLAVAGVGPDGAAINAAPARVDLAAPGTRLRAPGPGGGQFSTDGASGAAALTAGTAALLLSHEPALTPDRLAARLKATAYRPGTTVPDPLLGWGTVDPVAALSTPTGPAPTAAALPAPQVVVPPAPDPTPVRRAAALAWSAGALAVVVALGAGAARVHRRRTGAAPDEG
ncbi:S8 family serine peptidase [Kitasatospora sp. NPDC088134]|uniref:S8 family serine peptidase n=1 Tax=Kitasatospora sp. NPDC088134 TaxID=3364071 RepID=UPI003803E8C8